MRRIKTYKQLNESSILTKEYLKEIFEMELEIHDYIETDFINIVKCDRELRNNQHNHAQFMKSYKLNEGDIFIQISEYFLPNTEGSDIYEALKDLGELRWAPKDHISHEYFDENGRSKTELTNKVQTEVNAINRRLVDKLNLKYNFNIEIISIPYVISYREQYFILQCKITNGNIKECKQINESSMSLNEIKETFEVEFEGSDIFNVYDVNVSYVNRGNIEKIQVKLTQDYLPNNKVYTLLDELREVKGEMERLTTLMWSHDRDVHDEYSNDILLKDKYEQEIELEMDKEQTIDYDISQEVAKLNVTIINRLISKYDFILCKITNIIPRIEKYNEGRSVLKVHDVILTIQIEQRFILH